MKEKQREKDKPISYPLTNTNKHLLIIYDMNASKFKHKKYTQHEK